MSFFLIPPLHNNNISIDQINLTSDEIDTEPTNLKIEIEFVIHDNHYFFDQ